MYFCCFRFQKSSCAVYCQKAMNLFRKAFAGKEDKLVAEIDVEQLWVQLWSRKVLTAQQIQSCKKCSQVCCYCPLCKNFNTATTTSTNRFIECDVFGAVLAENFWGGGLAPSASRGAAGVEGRAPGMGCGEGISPCSSGIGSGERVQPPPPGNFLNLCLEMARFTAYLRIVMGWQLHTLLLRLVNLVNKSCHPVKQ